eukprot:360244-Chlamydomonas_euryale.AAC.2
MERLCGAMEAIVCPPPTPRHPTQRHPHTKPSPHTPARRPIHDIPPTVRAGARCTALSSPYEPMPAALRCHHRAPACHTSPRLSPRRHHARARQAHGRPPPPGHPPFKSHLTAAATRTSSAWQATALCIAPSTASPQHCNDTIPAQIKGMAGHELLSGAAGVGGVGRVLQRCLTPPPVAAVDGATRMLAEMGAFDAGAPWKRARFRYGLQGETRSTESKPSALVGGAAKAVCAGKACKPRPRQTCAHSDLFQKRGPEAIAQAFDLGAQTSSRSVARGR